MTADGEERRVRWSDLTRVARGSMVRRLGKPLLLAYLVLFVLAVTTVAASVVWMFAGR